MHFLNLKVAFVFQMVRTMSISFTIDNQISKAIDLALAETIANDPLFRAHTYPQFIQQRKGISRRALFHYSWL